MKAVEFVGGLLCGQTLHRKSDPGLYTFTDGKRCYKRPGGRRLLYRRLEPDGETVLYLHVGHRMALCEDCGCYTQRTEGVCALCGANLTAA